MLADKPEPGFLGVGAFEHRRVIEVVVAASRGRVRVLAGTGSNSTAERT